MILKKVYKIGFFIVAAFFMKGCVEPYEIETQNFKDMLVVEAAITNEFVYQEILLSHTIPLGEQGRIWETNAEVKIVDDTGNTYIFQEKSPGNYVSTSKFAAQPNVKYHLEIEINSGKSYISEPTALAQGANIDGLRAIRTQSPQGEDGIALLLSSTGNSTYYRYEYEETYKIVSNYAIAQDLVITTNENGDPLITLVPKTKEEYICYGTDYSRDLILSSTNSLTQNKLSNFLVRFVETGDPKISHRYSILVQQFAIGSEAFLYYKTLKELGVTESLFSQSQPGFISGNIQAVGNPDEMVIGFFSVSDVDSKRIFFNYSDFYETGKNQTFFATNCQPIRPTVTNVTSYINNESFKFYEASAPPASNSPVALSQYQFVPVGCVDCTVFGSNVVPEFWVED